MPRETTTDKITVVAREGMTTPNVILTVGASEYTVLEGGISPERAAKVTADVNAKMRNPNFARSGAAVILDGKDAIKHVPDKASVWALRGRGRQNG